MTEKAKTIQETRQELIDRAEEIRKEQVRICGILNEIYNYQRLLHDGLIHDN